MANLADAAIDATLAALEAMLREGLGRTEQAGRCAAAGERHSALARLVEADRVIAESASLRQAALTLLRNDALFDRLGGRPLSLSCKSAPATRMRQ